MVGQSHLVSVFAESGFQFKEVVLLKKPKSPLVLNPFIQPGMNPFICGYDCVISEGCHLKEEFLFGKPSSFLVKDRLCDHVLILQEIPRAAVKLI